jgi:CspA family cold shock protein
MSEVEEGVIQNWFPARGFGFASRANGPDIFVHVRNVRGKPQELARGQRVRFRVGEGTNGRPCAIDVELLEPVLTTSSPRWFRDDDARGDDAAHAALAETTFMRR